MKENVPDAEFIQKDHSN